MLKPKAFERVNKTDAELQAVAANKPSGEVVPSAAAPIVVEEILRGNLTKGPGAVEKPIDLRRKRSQRARDYWRALIAGNGLLLGSLFLAQGNVAMWVFVGAGVVIFSTGLTWIMWFIFDDY